MHANIIALNVSSTHSFSKKTVSEMTLLAGLGVAGDAHCGAMVQHRSRVAQDPTQPNLRQVHLVHAELFDELRAEGFEILPGDMGENITTEGVDLLALPVDTELLLGTNAIIRITGLRNPCAQLDHFQPGLMAAVLNRNAAGELVRKAGVMGVVVRGGVVHSGDKITVTLPPEPHQRLARV